MKEKLNSFFMKKVNMDSAITSCMVTFLVTIVLVVGWFTILTGGVGNLINTIKFAQILSVVDRVYIGDADTEELSDYAFSAMINQLGDRWSYYMTKDTYETYRQVQSNQYTGIGITLQKEEAGWHIVGVADDSPAAKAGILSDTYLVEVNGVIVGNMESSEISGMMKEHPNDITVVTEDLEGKRSTYSLSIAVIYSNPVSYELLDGKIGYVKLENFDETCADQTIEAIEALQEQDCRGLIFDVRDNGGGFVDEMTALLDYLLPEGEIFVSVNRNEKEKVIESDQNFIDLPMVVLVNENSYSAAECFAAVLREYDAATVVGMSTTGKNRSQTNVVLVDGSAVHISSKRYLTPKRVDLTQQGGLTPDVVVEYGEKDAQLMAALDVIRENT